MPFAGIRKPIDQRDVGMKKQITGLVALLILVVGCAEQGFKDAMTEVTGDGVIGGRLIQEKLSSSKWVVAVNAYTEVKEMQGKDEIRYTNVDACTGSMIAEDIVLTAAHCVKKNAEMSVTFSPMAFDSQAVTIKVKKYIIPKGFKVQPTINYEKMDEDIALLKLESKKPREYEVLGLTSDFPRLKNSFSFLAIGYGLNDSEVSGFEHAVTATGVSFEPKLNYFIADQRNSKGICPGDSGGPAIVTKDKRNFVIGVAQAVFSHKGDISKAKGIEMCKQHAIYTNVQYYRQWILDGIKALNR